MPIHNERDKMINVGPKSEREKYAPTPISDHVGAPARSVENLNTFALTVYVVSSSSSPSPSPPFSPGDCVRANPSSSNEPSVAGVLPRVAAEEPASRNAAVAGANAGVGVLAFVDAGVDSTVPVVPAVPAAPEADVDVVDGKPKTEPGAVVVVVDVVPCDDVRDGEPNEKPTLPALGGGGDDPSLAPGATPKPNCAGVAADAAVPKVNGDDFEGAPNGPPNKLLTGAVAALSFSLLLSFSSADFVDPPNMLPAFEEPVAVSPKIFDPGAREKANGAGGGADEAGWSFSLSLSSGGALSEPKSVEVFGGGLPKSKELVPGRLVPPPPLPPKEKVPEVLEDNPREKRGFDEGVISASFGV